MKPSEQSASQVRAGASALTAHTRGPWLVNGKNAQVDVVGRDEPICQLLWPTKVRSEDETLANGFLIAAAPELLGVARMVLILRQVGGMLPGVRELLDSLIEQADEAITKATGGPRMSAAAVNQSRSVK